MPASGAPWCCRWHHRGRSGRQEPLGAGDGHRVAHCHDDAGPYAARGYRLREIDGGTTDRRGAVCR